MKSQIEIPKECNALNLKAVGDLRLESHEVEPLRPGTVLLRVMDCGICSSDIERVYVNGTYHFPTVIGHEFSGEVIAVYDDENEDMLGKKAAVFPLLPCHECDACKKEEYALCENYDYFGSRRDGGFCEYLVVPTENLLFFENISYEEAAMCEPAAVALHASRRANITPLENVLIIGTGTIGFLIGTFCQRSGANVLMAGRRLESLELAVKYGFTPILNDDNIKESLLNETGSETVDTVFEAVGSNDAINRALELAMKEVIFVGNPKEDVVLNKNNYWRILRKELSVTGSWNSNFGTVKNDWKDVLSMLDNGEVDLKPLITDVYNMEDYEEAFERVKGKSLTHKIMISTRSEK